MGTTGGTETIARAMAEDPETVVHAVDMENALHTVHSSAVLAALQERAPALLPMMQRA